MPLTCTPLLPPPSTPAGARSTRRQQSTYSRHFQRLLENQGSWEPSRGHTSGAAAAPYMPPPVEAWEGLGQVAPELAELACNAADVASSMQYFEVRRALAAVARLPAGPVYCCSNWWKRVRAALSPAF